MGLIDRLTSPRNTKGVISYQGFASGGLTPSGVIVTDTSAMSCTAVYACVRVLAEAIASLCLEIYEDVPGGGMTEADDHPLMPVLRDKWNAAMTSFVARETLQGHLGLRGNGYAYIERKGKRVVGLWPLRPDRMMVAINEVGDGTFTVQYLYTPATGIVREFAPYDLLHIPALGGDGIVGLSPISLFRQAIGLALATEEAGSRFFGNSARPSGVYTHPGKLSDPAFDRLSKSIENNSGLNATGRTMILEEGMTWAQIGLSNEDSQYLETRAFQVQDIARIYRVPPHMIGAATADSQTYANVEQRSMEFLQYTLMPWVARWQQELERKLLTPAERMRYHIRFDLDDIVKADLKTRFEAYKIALAGEPFLSVNHVREEEELPPVDGGDEIPKLTKPSVPGAVPAIPPEVPNE